MGKLSGNLAIIGASYLQLPLINKAKEMGYTTHVFAWAANDVGERAADYFYPISIVEKDLILETCKKIGICGICSIASDLASITVNYVAHELNLTGNSLESTAFSTNKHLMRLQFEKNNDPSPKSILVDEKTDLSSVQLRYPIIVKPTDRSGSRGIFKLNDGKSLEEAVAKSCKESFEKKALIEEFVEGDEYSVEYISYKGNHRFLAVTQKFTTGSPHFIETGHLEPAPLCDEALVRVKCVVEHALNSLKIVNGASHSEIKILPNGDIYIIEIGARMGGDCIGSDLVPMSTGIDFVRCVIQVACGLEPDFTLTCSPKKVRCKFILTENDLEDFEKLKLSNSKKLLKTVDFHPENIGHITDSSNRAGCYIVEED